MEVTEIRKELSILTKYAVVMVASFSEFKDYKTYYKAAEMVLEKRKDVTFLAIGNKTDSTESKKLINPKKIEFFRFLGKRSNIESIINALDICVLATFTEGISNSILEYMALQKPVIATLGGGTKEIVDESETGFLVTVSDAHALADKIDQLLNDAELRKKMGEKGQKKVREVFSIEEMIDKYVSVYRNLSEKKQNFYSLIVTGKHFNSSNK
jgi:glycosyltransferase involved in cell wall biosynthesis